ncbi:hypothetical protein D3C85_1406690 [compost metagenome]
MRHTDESASDMRRHESNKADAAGDGHAGTDDADAAKQQDRFLFIHGCAEPADAVLLKLEHI